VKRALVLFLGLSLAFAGGCASLKEKAQGWFSRNPAPHKGSGNPEASPPPPDPLDASALGSRGDSHPRGVLAGRVIDTFNQHRPGALVQVVPVEQPESEPIEVLANAEGYFMVQGLQPGRKYRLAARARRGETVLGGTTIASPPNVVVVIKVSEDLPAPEPLSKRRSGSDSVGKTEEPRGPPRPAEQSWAPDAAPKYLHEPEGRASEGAGRAVPGTSPPLGTPWSRPELVAPTPTPSDRSPPVRPEYQTLGPGLVAQQPPKAELPAGAASESSLISAPDRPFAGNECHVSGTRLLDFALPDLSGRGFRFSQQRGKLVLLDFWGTWCTPCMLSVPYLVELQRRYGSKGLEVIGIAYEEGPRSEQVERLQFVKLRQGINYKLLLGGGQDCPVLQRLHIRSFPTLILVDEQGEMVWRSEGLSAKSKAQLEAEIRRRLQIGG
jgi:thiol-disulfide isomerase/thioredoxin